MGDNLGVLLGMSCYFAVMILIGYLMMKRNKGAEDFWLGAAPLACSLTRARWWPAGLGARCSGPAWHALAPAFGTATPSGVLSLGGASCLAVAGFFYMRRLWELKLLSLGDFFYIRYGRNAGILSTVLMCFTFTVSGSGAGYRLCQSRLRSAWLVANHLRFPVH